MKKLFFACFVASFVLFGCNQENKATDQPAANGKAEKNLASARAVAEAFKSGNSASLDTVIADDFVDHTDRGDKKGRDSLKAMIAMMHKNPNADMKMETIHELADDEYVFQWMRYTGTSDGSMGPKGPYDMHCIEVSKHKDGKIVEHWAYVDASEFMKMMGPMPAGAPAADTSKAKK